jgi:hypothetical protein
VNSRLISAILLSSFLPTLAGAATSQARVRRIILSCRHLGAHGIGYNNRSLSELSRKLTAADIPTLISLAAEYDLSVGVQFALASQCDAAILPVREAAVQHKVDFLDASDVMNLVSDFAGCTPQARQKALETRAELGKLREEEYARIEQESKRKAEEDVRIRRNGLKMLDPEQAKTLTHEERVEIYKRSLAAMGLSEDDPMTPEQKDLVQRMYRTMVLGEPGPAKPQ